MTTKSKAQQEKHKMSEIDENISKLFDIKKRLGKGAYGIVWKALDKRTNETLAVKKIFDAFRDETDAQRTFREIIFLKAFRNHPNVIKLNTVYKASNNLDIYLIFEYMESDLHNIIKKGSILKDIHKRYVMYQLINAIKYIHSGNVIHRDLKPSNVLIDSKCRCKLADFGLARSVSNRPIRDNNDMGSDPIVEPLLTDYVATRWYRAPEILVASKRYTKGIDMWSLGCILGEMIRGKPLFQGSSTINQIEKIVTALPEITDHDINAVGAGFGSVLLSKQISRERKTSLDELLCDAPGDAVNMVKSLLVLDPFARLTAKQTLCHPYVEKFRNSIPEIELNVDILPPFRDDVRLSVPEYRSKLYEIVQVGPDKSNNQRQNGGNIKNSISAKHRDRDQKTQIVCDKMDTLKKHYKSKQNINSAEKYITKEKYLNRSEKHEIETQPSVSIPSIAAKATKKVAVSPSAKRKLSKSHTKSMPIEQKSMQHLDEGAYFVVPRSKSHVKSSEPLEDHIRMHAFEKRHSIDYTGVGYGSLPNGDGISKQIESPPNNPMKKHDFSNKLYKTSSSLHRDEQHNVHHQREQQQQLPQQQTRMETHERRSTPIVSTILNSKASSAYVRNTKSDMIASGNTASTTKNHERICYEKRLKKLEEEIEKYKKEVKSFCKETFSYTYKQPSAESPAVTGNQQQQQQTRAKYNNSNVNMNTSSTTHRSNTKTTNFPSMTQTAGGTPKKNAYFQILSKGNYEMSLGTSTSGTSGGSGDHINNNNRSYHSGNSATGCMDMHNEQPHIKSHSHHNHHSHNHHQQQQRIRPVSKFISRPQIGENIARTSNSNFQ